MFSSQLKEVYQKKKYNEIKKTLREFSEAVNTIVYHAIHTDQMFLMIPGYSGTSFSIPTKLSLFYLWYLEKFSDILNDDGYSYQFFLTPVMEIQPHTNTVDFGLQPGNRLISVKVSQRSLYMPRMLMIILAHETAHYVGNVFRNREMRLDCIVYTMSHLMAYAIYPYNQVKSQEAQVRWRMLLECIIKQFKQYLYNSLKEKTYTIN